MTDAVKDWNACVEKAKKNLRITSKFVMVKGKLLAEAQRCYCAMGY